MSDCIERKAVRELLSEDKAEGYIETLDTMFEAWFCSEYCNGTTIEQRSVILSHVKALKQFLNSVEMK